VTNPFCNEWANKLLGVSRENKTDQKPFLECLYFRKIMESWKSKVSFVFLFLLRISVVEL